MPPRNFVQARIDGDVLIVMPLRNIGSVEHEATQAEWQEVLEQIEHSDVRHVVLDFGAIAYFGSAILEYVVMLSRSIRTKEGRLAICNLSEIGRDILATTKFDRLGIIVSTRAEALAALQAGPT
jgi:anti-anti-sigma factor